MTAPESVRIRDAMPEDAEAILQLYHEAYSVHNDPHRSPLAALKDTLDDVRHYLRHQRILVAEAPDGAIVATVAIRSIANIRRLAVSPQHKGSGLGGHLLEAAVDAARASGHEQAMLDTFHDHPWLPAFYERHGFAYRCTEDYPDGSRWRQYRREL